MRPMADKVAYIQIRRWRYIFLIVGLMWLLVGSGRSAAQQTVTLEAYLGAIAQHRSQILRAGNNAGQCAAAVTAAANTLVGITAVQLPDGSVMRVNHQGAAQALQTQPCNPARADQYLSGLCPARLCSVSRPQASLPAQANGQNSGTLAGAAGAPDNAPMPDTGSAGIPSDMQPPQAQPPQAPELAEPVGEGGASTPGDDEAGQPSPGDDGGSQDEGAMPADDANATEAARGETGAGAQSPNQPPALATHIGNTDASPTAVPNPPPPAVTPAPTETAVTRARWGLLLVVLLAVGLIGTAVALLLWPGKEAEPEEEEETSAVVTAVNEGRQFVEKGDYREAARRLFLAMLLALDEKGILRFDRHRTNLELLQQERLHKALVPSLTPVIVTYERVWYGLETLPSAEYERLVEEIKVIRDWRTEGGVGHR